MNVLDSYGIFLMVITISQHVHYGNCGKYKKAARKKHLSSRTVATDIWVLLQPDLLLCILFCSLQLPINLPNTMILFIKCFRILRK